MITLVTYALFCLLLCFSGTAYVIFSWYRVHRRMQFLCFRVGVIARKPLLPDSYFDVHPLLLFFFGGLQHILDREITRLEGQHRIHTLRLPPTMWPGQQLRSLTQRVDRIESSLIAG